MVRLAVHTVNETDSPQGRKHRMHLLNRTMTAMA
jgi:hypothetical protein